MPCQNVHIRIYSVHTPLEGTSLFDSIMYEDEKVDGGIRYEKGSDDDVEETEFFIEGRISQSYKIYRLRYREADETGMDDTTTYIQFRLCDPESVSLIREGGVSSTFLFEKDRRNISSYSTPLGPFEICTYTSNIENSLSLSGGRLVLDYRIEVKGLSLEANHLEIEVFPQSDK